MNKIIKVYTEDMKRQAEFTKQNFVSGDAALKNKLVAPTITIEQNGESTMSFTMLKNSEKWQQIKDPKNIYECNNRRYTAIGDKSIIENGKLVEVYLSELWYLLSKDFAQIHNVDTSVFSIAEHTITIMPKSDPKFKLTVNGKTYEDSEVKDQRGILLPRGSAGYCLWALLKANKQGWTLGICDQIYELFDPSKDLGVFNLKTDMQDLLHNIKYVQELWGGVLVFDSMNKIIHLRNEELPNSDFNKWKGFLAKPKKNMLEYPTVEYDNNLITKAYVLGANKLNIKAVNNDKSYVENYSYTTKVYEGYITNNNIHFTNDDKKLGQNQLKFWAEQELKKLCKPRVKISAQFTMTNDFETYDIHDIVKIEVSATETIQKRVIRREYDYFDNYSDSVECGDKILNERDYYNFTYQASTEPPKFDWSGSLGGSDIFIDVTDELFDFFGGWNGSLQDLTILSAEHITENTNAVAEVRVYADETFATVESFTSFSKLTNDRFTQSFTKISQLSDALSAQIKLEAQHHTESLEYTTNSVSGLRLYVNGEFSEAVLSSSYGYTDNKTGEVSNALAQFTTYANKEYAKASVVSIMNDNIASISTKVDKDSARIDLVAGIDNRSGVMALTSNYFGVAVGAGNAVSITPYGSSLLHARACYINAPTIHIYGTPVKWGGLGNNYLVKA